MEAFTSLPRKVTADLAVKNVFVGKNALCDQFALLAISNVWKYLHRAYVNGKDIEAREGMMMASLAAGCAFGTAGTRRGARDPVSGWQ